MWLAKNVETISCNTSYKHILRVGEFLWFRVKPQYFRHTLLSCNKDINSHKFSYKLNELS